VTTKNPVFCDVTQCGSCTNRRFGAMHRLHHQGDKNRRARKTLVVNSKIVFVCTVFRLLDTANVVTSYPTLVTLMIERICYSETSVLTRATRLAILEDGIIHSHRRENLKSYDVNDFCVITLSCFVTSRHVTSRHVTSRHVY
jgi:hypothetical protein